MDPEAEKVALPLVYSCSGCSSAGQMANWLAVRLDRERKADMSCIAGVGGNVKPLVVAAQKAPVVVAIDGCPLHCALHSLKSRGVEPASHVDLSKMEVKKLAHTDFDPLQAEKIYLELVSNLGATAMPELVQTLDVRVIPIKDKHPSIFNLFDSLKPGQSFQIVNDHDPAPLYYQFQAVRTGLFGWEKVEEGPEVWRVNISRA